MGADIQMAHLSRKMSRAASLAIGVFLTAATGGVSATQLRCGHACLVSAVAKAPNQLRPVTRPDKFQDGQRAKSRARNTRLFRSLVPPLLDLRSPAHVAGLVGPVVIDSIEAMGATRFRPNVSQKSAEVVAPSVAHHDPTASVVLVFGAASCGAPSVHADPCRVFGCSGSAVLPVRALSFISLHEKVMSQAPTTRRVTVAQLAYDDTDLISAIAGTQHPPESASGCGVSNDGEAAKSQSVKIEACRHEDSIPKALMLCGTRDHPKARPVSGFCSGGRLSDGHPV